MSDHDQRAPGEYVDSEPVENLERRRQLKAWAEVVEHAERYFDRNEPVDPQELLDAVTRAFPTPSVAPRARHVSELTEGVREAVRRRMTGEEKPITTPFGTLNEYMAGGYRPGVHLLMGATGVGKTVMVVQVALHAAQSGHTVAFAPIEMGAGNTTIRLAAEVARVPFSDAVNGRLTDDEFSRFGEGLDAIAELPIVVDDLDPTGYSASKVGALCAQAVASNKDPSRPPLIIVDYAQLLSPEEGDRADIRECIRAAAAQAHEYATKHNCVILMVSSVGRSAYKFTSGSPAALREAGIGFEVETVGDDVIGHRLHGAGMLVGLGKESGELEFFATSVAVMVGAPGGAGVALAIPKNRNGEGGRWVPLVFERARHREATDHEAQAIAAAFMRSPKSQAVQAIDPAIAEAIADVTRQNPGLGSSQHERLVRVLFKKRGVKASNELMRDVRAEMLADGEIVDCGGSAGHAYYVPEAVPAGASEVVPEPVPEVVPGGLPEGLPDSAGSRGTSCRKPRGAPKGPGARQAVPDGSSEPLGENHSEPVDAEILAYVGQHPKSSTRAIRTGIGRNAREVGDSVARLLTSGRLVNVGSAKARKVVLGTGSEVVPSAGTTYRPEPLSEPLSEPLAGTTSGADS